MKTTAKKGLIMIVAIILVLSLNNLFSQNRLEDQTLVNEFINIETSSEIPKPLDKFNIKVNPTTFGLHFPLYEGICELSVLDIIGGVLYYDVINVTGNNQDFIIPIKKSKSKVLIVNVVGKNFTVSKSFYIN